MATPPRQSRFSRRPAVIDILPVYPIEYAATFEDAIGSDTIVIEKSKTRLSTTLRGEALSGRGFDSLGVVADEVGSPHPFTVDRFGDLASGTLVVRMPVGVEIDGKARLAELRAVVRIPLPQREPAEDWSIPMTLDLGDGREPVAVPGTGGDFESALVEISRKLPSDVRLLSCFSCGLSDYSPSGNQIFGDLACFRGTKAAYRRVHSKWDLFKLWPSMTETVQETHLCPEWEPRPVGRGYRG